MCQCNAIASNIGYFSIYCFIVIDIPNSDYSVLFCNFWKHFFKECNQIQFEKAIFILAAQLEDFEFSLKGVKVNWQERSIGTWT